MVFRLMKPRHQMWIGLIALGMVAVVRAFAFGTELAPGAAIGSGEPVAPLPPVPELDKAKIRLGGRLFHDPILSKRQTLSCSSCHDLSTGGTVRLQRTIGYDGRMHAFNAPTIFNVGNNYRLGWRGKYTSLTIQNENVLLDRNLMANDWQTLVPRLTADVYYRTRFRMVYGTTPSRDNILDALVTFQQSLTTPNAAFDRFLEGDTDAITAKQQYGYRLFKTYGCVSCHQGSNIGGNMFQIFGVFADPTTSQPATAEPPPSPLDYAEGDWETFRVPSLRNVEVTAPYFHDGRAWTLHEAVSIMGISQLGRDLDENEIEAIVSFLESLTGDYNGKRL